MSAPEPSDELAAAVDEVFLGWWPDDLMNIVRQPYTPGAITAYAHRDGGTHLNLVVSADHDKTKDELPRRPRGPHPYPTGEAS